MINIGELKTLAQARIGDAAALLRLRRFHGAVYLSGYAIELALKARICATLNWPGFPLKGKEFEGLSSFKTHDLEILLHLSGREDHVKTNFTADWSVIAQWDPEVRYRPIERAHDKKLASPMVKSAKVL